MSDRHPALLVVLIDTTALRWYAGALPADAAAIPLIRSDDGNLDQYMGADADGQVSFLRHRLAGVLQRGCDRMYPRHLKASHFVLIADGDYPQSVECLTERLAEHFVQWMMNPPVTYAVAPPGFANVSTDQLKIIAGELPSEVTASLDQGLPQLIAKLQDPNQWELIPRPRPA